MLRSTFPGKVPIVASILASFVLLSLSGCGGGEFPVVEAKGKVVSNGQPVTVGTVTFVPIGETGKLETGKPATAAVGPDGTFVLTTNDRFDGAIVGKHRVTYVGPEGGDEEAEEENVPAEGSPEERAKSLQKIRERRAQQKKQFVQQGELTVEVKKDGENDFTIEVVPAGK